MRSNNDERYYNNKGDTNKVLKFKNKKDSKKIQIRQIKIYEAAW